MISLSQLKIPDLPAEIFGLIAEHLVGQHSFGTAAALNVLSRAVHSETSPVVWETIVYDSRVCEAWEERPPPNLRYTKYVWETHTGPS